MKIERHGTSRVVSLDVLRFFAAMCIVFGHIHIIIFPVKDTWANWAFFEIRSIGMTLFFILSGFVISLNYQVLGKMGCSLKLYFIHRFSRIYPLFLLIFIYEILFASNPIKGIPIGDLYRIFYSYLTLTQSWFYDVVGITYLPLLVFGISWSLSVEFFFYLVYPFVEKVSKALNIKDFKRCLYVFMSVFFIILFIYYQYSLSEVQSEGINFDWGAVRWFVYFSPYLSVFEFIIGCILGRIYLQAPTEWTPFECRFRKWFLAISVMGLFVLYTILVSRIYPRSYVQYGAFYLLSRGLSPFLAYIVFYVARYVRIRKGQALAILLGDLSYPIYLVHWTFLERMFGSVSFSSWFSYAVTVFYLISFLLFFSYGILKLYDLPVRTAVRQGLTRLLCRSE
jgi:peptidoglycan/LPS O-acetylase OafA/YrhL